MIAIGHTSVGVLIGLATVHFVEPAAPIWISLMVAATAGVASHYVMDLLPHGHYNFNGSQPTKRSLTILGLDLVLPILVVCSILCIRFGFSQSFWLVTAAIIGAQAPDVFDGLLSTGLIPKFGLALAERRLHLATHWHNPANANLATNEGGRKLQISDLWQMAVTIVALFSLTKF